MFRYYLEILFLGIYFEKYVYHIHNHNISGSKIRKLDLFTIKGKIFISCDIFVHLTHINAVTYIFLFKLIILWLKNKYWESVSSNSAWNNRLFISWQNSYCMRRVKIFNQKNICSSFKFIRGWCWTYEQDIREEKERRKFW